MTEAECETLMEDIIVSLRLHGPADAHGLAGRFPDTDFNCLLFCVGMAAGSRRIVMESRDQPWTGELADIRWKAA